MIFIYAFYIDLFVEQNFLMNLIVLSLTYLFCKCSVSFRRLRMGLAALCGAVAATLLLLFGPGYQAAVACLALLIVPAMLYISFGWHGKRDFFIRIGISWLSIVILNGVAEAFYNLTGIKSLTLYAGVVVLAVSAVLVEMLHNSLRRQARLYHVVFKNRGRQAECLGLYDSGNLLTLPQSGEAVHIVSPGILKLLDAEDAGAIRMIPYRALGTDDGWISVVVVEQMQIRAGAKSCELSDVWLGKAQEELLQGKNYQVILNEAVERKLS